MEAHFPFGSLAFFFASPFSDSLTREPNPKGFGLLSILPVGKRVRRTVPVTPTVILILKQRHRSPFAHIHPHAGPEGRHTIDCPPARQGHLRGEWSRAGPLYLIHAKSSVDLRWRLCYNLFVKVLLKTKRPGIGDEGILI